MSKAWAFVSVDLEVTTRCQNSCAFCPHDKLTRPRGEMSEKTFRAVLEKLAPFSPLIVFSGMGDPLSHPKIFDFIRYGKYSGCEIGVVVNPARLGKEQAMRLADARPNRITVSMPTLKKDVFASFCPSADFSSVLDRVEGLIAACKNRVGVHISGLKTPLNPGEEQGFKSFWKSKGVSADMKTCHGRGGNLKTSAIYSPAKTGLRKNQPCGLFTFHTFVTWQGDVLACCHDLTGETRLGSLLNEDAESIAEKKGAVVKQGDFFGLCAKCDEVLRNAPAAEGLPPRGKIERRDFFRKISAAVKKVT